MKRRIFALVLVLALFVTVLSVSALAANNTKEAEITLEERGTYYHYVWLSEIHNVGVRITDYTHPHAGTEHLYEGYNWNHGHPYGPYHYIHVVNNPAAHTKTFIGNSILHDIRGLTVFAW